MPKAHRHEDDRNCGATTVVENQSTVYVNGKLWAVHGDPNTHGAGNLIKTGTTVFVEGTNVIVHTPDSARPDNADHNNPKTAEGSDDVYAYDKGSS